MSYQNLNPELIPDQKTVDTFVNDDVEMTSPECPRRSRRHEQEYHSSLDDVLCIICNETKKDSHGKIVPVTKMFLKKSGEEVHMVEKQLTDFATLHKDKNTKYETAADRIFLTLSTRDKLFTANVGYHKDCYASFRSPKWKIDKAAQYSEKERHATEFIDLIEYLIVKQKEVYTLVQLRSLYAEIKGVTIEAVRGVDIKSLIEKCLENKVKFCKPTDGSNKISEYAISSDFNILPDTLHAMHTGEGITNYLQVKNISKSISANIKSIPKKSWPPTPQDILKYEEPLDKILYNLIAWIVSPKSSMGKDGYVKLPKAKMIKVTQCCNNIQSLVPGGQPNIGQILLSLNVYGQTGSSNLINDLRHFGYGIPYTEVLFIQDKWAEWTDKQKSIIPSNIKKGIIVTHVFDNIDWKDKNINKVETHHTNSILIQKSGLSDDFANVTLEPNYDFVRKKHRSYKSEPTDIPSVYFKRGKAKILDYRFNGDRRECNSSSLKTLAWVLARLQNPTELRVPAWSGFQELTSPFDTDKINVGYLPPIPDTPTEMRVIYAAIKRTQNIMIELETDFIFIEADQAIYTKVLDAMFKMEDEEFLNKVIPRMGGFHITICMLRTIYSLFERCGIVQLLHTAGLGGLGSVRKALKGGDVKEGILLNKKLYEALLRSKIMYLDEVGEEALVDSDVVEELRNDLSIKGIQKALSSGVFKSLPKLKGNMARILDIYIEMVDMMMNFIHFLRTGNWNGYLEVLFEFLPYCFRLNRHNYARNLSFYYVHMLALKKRIILHINI